MGPTETLAKFIVQTGLDDIPAEAVAKGKWAIADGVAVTLGGWQMIGPQVVALVEDLGGKPQSTIAGAGIRTNPPLAALANAVMSHVLDYDDINESMGGHPTGPVLGAVMALGEMMSASGRECLLAYLIGVETETKIGRALIKSLYVKGWHPTAVLGVMGSAAACAKLLDLNLEQTIMALGMAGSFAGGLKHNFGTLTKSLHVGQAAQNGLMAAMLVQRGWTASSDILEGHFGFGNLFAGRDEFDFREMTDHLGAPWDIIEPGIKLKKYPCCGSIHPAVEALLQLRERERLAVDSTKSLMCTVPSSKQHILVHPRPATGLEAKFSLEYCLARALSEGRISMAHFQDSNVHDSHIIDLLPRVSVLQDPGMAEWAGRVEVETEDGRSLIGTCPELPGIESEQALDAKFNDCVAPVIGDEQSKEVFEAIRRFDELANIKDFMGKLIKE